MKIMALTDIPGGKETSPGWFLLPDSAILRSGNPFFVPEFDSEFRGYPTLIIRLDRLGKSISPRFAHRYFAEATLGVTVRGEESLRRLRTEGLPWTEAVVFDRCCLTGDFLPVEKMMNAGSWKFCFGERMVDCAASRDGLPIGEMIARLSRNNTIKTGDLLLIPLAESGERLEIGETLTAWVDDQQVLEIRIR